METRNLTIEKAAKIIYNNKIFSINFARYEEEFFKPTINIQYRDTFERFSEFECEMLLEKYEWFKTLKKFKIERKNVDPSQTNGYEISLNGKQCGFIEVYKSGKLKLMFCIKTDSTKEGWIWSSWKGVFSDMQIIKELLNVNYPKIQEKYDLYLID